MTDHSAKLTIPSMDAVGDSRIIPKPLPYMKIVPATTDQQSATLSAITCPACGAPFTCSSLTWVQASPCPGCNVPLLISVTVSLLSARASSEPVVRMEVAEKTRTDAGKSFASKKPKFRFLNRAWT